MAYVRHTPFLLAASFCLLVPDVALARREPGSAEAPAAAAQPVAPAAPAEGTVPVAAATVEPAPVAATPVAATPGAATPVVSAPAPAPVVSASMQAAPAPVRTPAEKRANGLIAGGAAVLLTTFVYTSVLGAIAIDKGRKGRVDAAGLRIRDEDRIAFGRRLMIPVVGPFLALGHTDSALKRYGAAFSGVAQVTGAVLVVVGAAGRWRSTRARRFGWSAGATKHGAGVLIHGRF